MAQINLAKENLQRVTAMHEVDSGVAFQEVGHESRENGSAENQPHQHRNQDKDRAEGRVSLAPNDRSRRNQSVSAHVGSKHEHEIIRSKEKRDYRSNLNAFSHLKIFSQGITVRGIGIQAAFLGKERGGFSQYSLWIRN